MDIEKELPEVKRNILLKNYTTFKIGGRAKYFFVAETKENLINAILVVEKYNLPFFILGGGSNLLISDNGFKGLVIKIKNSKYKIKNTKISSDAGVFLSALALEVAKNNLAGFEWAAGIPGTVGGAIYGNAGAFKKSMKDIVKKVEVFNTKTKRIEVFKNKNLSHITRQNLDSRFARIKDCKFAYRDSIFKKKNNLIILSVEIQLKNGNGKEIKEKIQEFLKHRKNTQPLNLPSAGSIFKNPPGFSAAELIEKCGLKGKRAGGAGISKKHANFIVNLGNAKAKDVIKLINLIKKRVKNKFGVELEEEIHYLEFKNEKF